MTCCACGLSTGFTSVQRTRRGSLTTAAKLISGMVTNMLTANQVFDQSAAGWSAKIDSTTTPGKAVVTATLPDGWAEGEIYLIIKPFQLPFVIQPFDALTCTLDVSAFGQRGYIYITASGPTAARKARRSSLTTSTAK